MLKTIATTALIGALLLAPAAMAQEQNFTVVNHTGYVVVMLHVSPADQDRWGPDILGAEVLANNETAEVSFAPQDDTCLWDIRVTYDDGAANDLRQVNLCEVSTVELSQ